MGFGSVWHWLLVILVLVLLFGAGKISGLMGDLAKGIKSFKKEMAEGDGEPAPAPEVIEHKPKPAAKAKTATRAKTPRTPKAG
jgi:sec-independent protein translocase protein TatA